MKLIRLIKIWLLMAIVALSGNGAVKANIASGVQNLSLEVHQEKSISKSLNRRGKTECSTTGVPVIFIEEDKETGLLYAKARFYDPDTGKFLSEDAWEGDSTVAPSLHRYLYAYQNPTVWVDPTGNYNEAGHFYTTYYVAREVGYDHETAHELAFYSQLPDEVGAYDAISNQAAHLFTRSASQYRGRVSDSDLDRLTTYVESVDLRLSSVQGGMHGLTGELASVEGEKARKLVLNKNIGIAGIAIHRRGDTYAHRIMDGGELTSDARLYSEGWGHLEHGKAPDQIHRRKELYLGYVIDLARTLAKRQNKNKADVNDAVIRTRKKASQYMTLVEEAEKKFRPTSRSSAEHYLVPPHSAIDNSVVSLFESFTYSSNPEVGDGSNIVKPIDNQIPHLGIRPKRFDILKFKETIDNKTVYSQFSEKNSDDEIVKNANLYIEEIQIEKND